MKSRSAGSLCDVASNNILSEESSDIDLCGSLPFDRVEFDDSRIDDLVTWFEELREKRGITNPLMIRKREQLDAEAGHKIRSSETPLVVDARSTADLSQGKNLQSRSLDKSQSEALITNPTMKRKRGRPRKLPVPTDRSCRDTKRSCTESLRSEIGQEILLDDPFARRFSGSNDFNSRDSDVLSIDSASSVPLQEFELRRYLHPVRLSKTAKDLDSNHSNHVGRPHTPKEMIQSVTRRGTRSSKRKRARGRV
jgi:hypothetical protein